MKRSSTSVVLGITAIILAVIIPKAAAAQSLARRVADVRDGKIRLEYAARPDLCGNGNYISRGNNNGRMSWDSDYNEDVEYTEECLKSRVRLVISKSDGQIVKIRTYVGGRWRPGTSSTIDVGAVSTREAADYLMSVAATNNTKVASEAIFPATIADSVEVWPSLLKIARDDSRSNGVRSQAVFWLSQSAGEKVTQNLRNLAVETSVDREVRKQAIFALSQRRDREGVPALIEIARNNRDPELKKTALFWLGQSRDPRALSLFEEILSH